jgi:hypothetical protein
MNEKLIEDFEGLVEDIWQTLEQKVQEIKIRQEKEKSRKPVQEV